MFSRLALRSGAFSCALQRSQGQRLVLSVTRCCSTEEKALSLTKRVDDWDKATDLYYGPSRDLINFPAPKQAEEVPKVRMGFIPDSWFMAFYEKTGATGPYMFGAGLITFLLSKEIWVVEHGFTEFLCFWTAVTLLAKKFGPKFSTYLTKQSNEFEKIRWTEPLKESKAISEDFIKEAEMNIWREEGQKYLYEAKQENVDLQLEAVYRERLAQVHQAVKKRLDYQYDVENTERRFQQTHMVNWIVENVKKGITAQQERDSIAKCIQDLKGLAPAAKA